MDSEMIACDRSSPVPRPRQADTSSQLVQQEAPFKTPGRAAPPAVRSSRSSTSRLNSSFNKIEDAVSTDDALSPTNIRKRKNDSHLDPFTPKRARAMPSRKRSSSQDLSSPQPPKTRRSSSLDETRSTSAFDLQAALAAYPEYMRTRLRFLYDRRDDRRRWYGLVRYEAVYVPRSSRRSFVKAAQDLCQAEDFLLPPTVLFGNIFDDPGWAAILKYIPRLRPTDEDDAPEIPGVDEVPDLDWHAPLVFRSPMKLPKKKVVHEEYQLCDEAAAFPAIMPDLDEVELNELRLHDSEVVRIRGLEFYGAVTMQENAYSSDEDIFADSDPVLRALNRTASSESNHANDSFWNMIHQGEEQRESDEPTPTQSPASPRNTNHSSSLPSSLAPYVPRARRSPSPMFSSIRSLRSPRSPRRSPTPLGTARSPSPRTARSPSPPPADVQLMNLEKSIETALRHLGKVGKTVIANVLDMVLLLKRARSSARTLLKKALGGEDVTAKTTALVGRRTLRKALDTVSNY